MKKRIMVIIMLFCLIGIVLGMRKSYYNEKYEATGQIIQMDSSHTVSQKILGSGYSLTSFSVSIYDMNTTENADINIYLTKESKYIDDTNILAQTSIIANQIEDGYLRCNFDNVYLTYDRDYYIVLQYEEPDNIGYIELNMGEGISTCPSYINDDKNVNPLAYDMECVSGNTSLMFLWKFIFVFLTYTMAYAVYRNKPIIKSMAMVTLCSAIFIYTAGLFNKLVIGYYLYFFMALLALVYILVKLVKADEKSVKIFYIENIKGQILIWFTIFVICIVGSRGKSVIDSDVVNMWGLEVKNIYVLGRYPIHEMSNVGCYRYPPLYPIFQYLCMMIYGHWSESILYFGKYFMMMSIIISCCSYKKFKGLLNGLALVVICLCIPEVFFNTELSYSLFADEVLGIIFGFALICTYRLVWKREKVKTELFVAILALGLTKDAGLILGALLAISVLMVKNIYSIMNNKRFTVEPQMTITGLVALVVSFIPWQIYVGAYKDFVSFGVSAINKIEDVYLASIDNNAIVNMMPKNENLQSGILASGLSFFKASGIDLSKILEFITGKAESYKYEIIPIHLKKLLFEGYYGMSSMTLPFSVCFVLLILAFYLISKKYNKNVSDVKQVMFTITIIAVGYIAFLHLVYMFTFTEQEALMIASEPRYLGSFLTGVAMLVIYSMLNESDYDKTCINVNYGIVALLLLVFTNVGEAYRISLIDADEIYSEFDTVRDDAVKLRKYLEEDDSVYIITEKYSYGYYIYYNYELSPIKNGNYRFPIDTSIYEPIYDLEVEQLYNNICKYKYVYLRNTYDGFGEKYGYLFDDINDIDDASLYTFGDDGLLYKVY